MNEDTYLKLKELVESIESDYYKFYQKNNKTAGTRVRQQLQSIRTLAQDIRMDISATKKLLANE